MNSARRETAKHPMLVYSKAAVTVLALLAASLSSASAFAQARLDGATIVNSGSTNTTGWRITLHSDGRGMVDSRPFSVPRSLARRFLRDARAARDARAMGQPCVKSASFGYRLNVYYHDWTSPDLSCPPLSDSVQRLASDAAEIEHVAAPPSGFRRIRVPLEPHRIPPTPPAKQAERGPA